MLNHTSPRYSAAMELLCSLPMEPAWAAASTLVVDLKLPNQRILKPLVSEVRAMGIVVSEEQFEGRGLCLAIPRHQWSKVNAITEAYWMTVNV